MTGRILPCEGQEIDQEPARRADSVEGATLTISFVEQKVQQGSTVTAEHRDVFAKVLEVCARSCKVDLSGRTLVVGGTPDEVAVLQRVGFRCIALSNIESVPLSSVDVPARENATIEVMAADAEHLQFPDDSYDTVMAHDVLHHCRSPHAALLEMIRVSRRHVIIMEPHDSFFMRVLEQLQLATFPYELGAVRDHNGQSGGVRDSCIPNFVFRWNRREVFKTVSSFIPDRDFAIHEYPYWNLNLDERALSLRKETKLHIFTSLLGADGFLFCLRFLQQILNRLPVVSRQGNKFLCCVEKSDQLKPWLVRDESGIAFNPEFGCEETTTTVVRAT